MENLVKIIKDENVEYWLDVTEYVKGIMESTVTKVEVLVTSGVGAKEVIAEAIAKEILNTIADVDDLTIYCECMKITFSDGRTVSIVTRT